MDAILQLVIVVYAQGEGAMAYLEMTSFPPIAKPLPQSPRPYPDSISGIMPLPYDQLVTLLGIQPGTLVRPGQGPRAGLCQDTGHHQKGLCA